MVCPKCRQAIGAEPDARYCSKCGYQFDAPTEAYLNDLRTFHFDADVGSVEVNGIRQELVKGFVLECDSDTGKASLIISKDQVYEKKLFRKRN